MGKGKEIIVAAGSLAFGLGINFAFSEVSTVPPDILSDIARVTQELKFVAPIGSYAFIRIILVGGYDAISGGRGGGPATDDGKGKYTKFTKVDHTLKPRSPAVIRSLIDKYASQDEEDKVRY